MQREVADAQRAPPRGLDRTAVTGERLRHCKGRECLPEQGDENGVARATRLRLLFHGRCLLL
jgi:hypothetical protein